MQQQNLRQAGRGGGKLSLNEYVLIPGKICSKDVGKQRGFGSSSIRPDVNGKVNNSVGPGQYDYSHPTLKKESSSSKGYGPLISNLKRLTQQVQVQYTGPGPGTYNGCLAKERDIKGTIDDLERAEKGGKQGDDLPGPGQYDTYQMPHYAGKDMAWTSKSRNYAAFLTIKRNFDLNMNSNPAVGSYDLVKQWKCAEEKHNLFKNNSSRDVGTPHKTGGPPPIIYMDKQRGCSTPGPGSYNMQSFLSISSNMEEKCKQSVRGDQKSTGRITMKQNGRNIQYPGPGHYYSKNTNSWRAGTAMPFKSMVPQTNFITNIHYQQQNLPGPALYTPNLHQRKSFHLNAKRNFIQSV